MEQALRCHKVKDSAWVVVDPFSYLLDGLDGEAGDISAFSDEPANHPVGVLVGSTLPCGIRMGVEDHGARSAREGRGLEALDVKKFAAIVDGDGLEQATEESGSKLRLYRSECAQNRCL